MRAMRKGRQKDPPQHQRSSVDVDVDSLLAIENNCTGCSKGQKCCCASYKVCATLAEVKRIIRVLPAAAEYCPHLLAAGVSDNMFNEEEPGLFTINTTGDGLCVFGYWSGGRTHCSLHTVAMQLGLPLEQVKPKVCLLWPLHFSDDEEVLGLIDDALRFACNMPTAPGSRSVSPGFLETIDRVYGEGCGAQVQTAAESGSRRTLLVTRR